MCGIAAYLGPRQAAPILIGALSRLRYRGEDAAGIAIASGQTIQVRRSVGRIRELARDLWALPQRGHCGIGHTRGATVGGPDLHNAHPHVDGNGRIAVVHNGLIANHQQLRRSLEADGAVFSSETDSEVIPHLIARHYRPGSSSEEAWSAVRDATVALGGGFAFAVLFADHPGRIFAACRGWPLVLGTTRSASPDRHGRPVPTTWMMASHVVAMLPRVSQVCEVMDGSIVEISPSGAVVRMEDGGVVVPMWQPWWAVLARRVLTDLVRHAVPIPVRRGLQGVLGEMTALLRGVRRDSAP